MPLKNSTTCISSKDKEIKPCPLETQTARQRASVSVEGLPSPTVPVRCAADYKVGNKVTPSARFHAGSNYKTSRHGRAIQNASRIWESPYWKLPHIPTISPFSQKAIPSRPAAGVIGSVTSISTSCRIRVSSDIDGEHSLAPKCGARLLAFDSVDERRLNADMATFSRSEPISTISASRKCNQ